MRSVCGLVSTCRLPFSKPQASARVGRWALAIVGTIVVIGILYHHIRKRRIALPSLRPSWRVARRAAFSVVMFLLLVELARWFGVCFWETHWSTGSGRVWALMTYGNSAAWHLSWIDRTSNYSFFHVSHFEIASGWMPPGFEWLASEYSPARTELTGGSTPINVLARGRLLIPHWMVALILGVWPGAVAGRAAWRRWGRRWRDLSAWHRRLRAGLCPYCGYDLRASFGRCPECGKAIPEEIVRRAIEDVRENLTQ